MKCSKCNNEIQKGYKFCPICGTPVTQEIKCPKCGSTDIPQDSKFCPDCGALLGVNQEDAQRRFENAKKQEEEKARLRKQAEFAKQQEIARKKELERKAEESKRAELEKARREAEAKKRAEETKKTYINGHEYVDLGLPSRTKWSTCNIGAYTPEDLGNYYAWGKIVPNRSSSVFATGLKFMLKIASNEDITSKCDAATQVWGANWHIPSKNQFQELIQNTSSTWTSQNGVFGRLLTSNINGKKIFFPAAGHLDGATFEGKHRYGNYWSSTAKNDSGNAYLLAFGAERFDVGFSARDIACSLRPVSG